MFRAEELGLAHRREIHSSTGDADARAREVDHACLCMTPQQRKSFMTMYQYFVTDGRTAAPAVVASGQYTPKAPITPPVRPSIIESIPFLATHAGKVDFLAGDYGVGTGYLQSGNSLQLPHRRGHIPFRHIGSVSIATEQSVKKVGGALGWGAAGGLAFGPLGMLAGLVGGGNKTQVTFIIEFTDGTKVLARALSAEFAKLQAAGFST